MTVRPEDYAELGWRIFPVYAYGVNGCTCGDRQCKSPGKHPIHRNWQNNASSDPDTIRRMWVEQPGANIGLLCGAASGVFVVDIDDGKDGFKSMDEYDRYEEPLPETLLATSGGGGRHKIYRYPTDGGKVPNRVGWLPGVDIRGDGGYIVLAPSNHQSGSRYAWDNWGFSIADAPRSLIHSIREPSKKSSSGGNGGTDKLSTSYLLAHGIPEGERNDTLFRWASRYRRRNEAEKDEGLEGCKELAALIAAKSGDFELSEALRCVESAYSQDHSDDFGEIRIAGWNPDGDVTDDDEEYTIEDLSDVGNRNRFVRKHGDMFRYVYEIGWFQWSKSGWKKVTTEVVTGKCEDVLAMLDEERNAADDAMAKKRLYNWRLSTGMKSHTLAIESLARQHPKILKSVSDFDKNKFELACANGVVDLRTGEIRPFTQDDLFTKNTNVVYDPNASSDIWDNFLTGATNNDDELKKYLQLAAGYTATGSNQEECFFIIVGAPNAGKSTYIDAVKKALGSYAVVSQSNVFMYNGKDDTAKDEIARLAGQRMVSVSEIREGSYFNEILLKQITGGDDVTAKFLYKDIFQFSPQFKIWFATNHDPITRDPAMMRRIKRIEFLHPIIHKDKKIKEFLKNTDEGAQAVLTWMVQGAVEYLRNNTLEEPNSVKQSVANYQMEHDNVGNFAVECLDFDATHWIRLTDLYMLWRRWNESQNTRPGSRDAFKQKIIEKYRGNDSIKIGPAEDGQETAWGLRGKVNAQIGNMFS